MRKTFLTILGTALLAVSLVQVASAAEHKARKAVRAPAAAPVTEPFRNSNNYWPAPSIQSDDRSFYQNRGLSAPAGR